MSERYNGWANWETWLFNLYHEESIYDTLKRWAEEDYDDVFAGKNENSWENDFCYHYTMALKDVMVEMVFDPVLESMPSGYITDLLSYEPDHIDWRDITASYAHDILSEIKSQR